LKAALEVIAQQGYAGASTREIADAAGINEVTLFRRFGNKQKLLSAAVEQEAENFVAAGIEYTGDIEADLQKVAQFYQSLLRTHGPMIRMLLSEMPRQPELVEVMATPIAIIARICAIIEQYQKDGVLIEEPPMRSFTALVGPIFIDGILAFLLPDALGSTFSPPDHVLRFLGGRHADTSEYNS